MYIDKLAWLQRYAPACYLQGFALYFMEIHIEWLLPAPARKSGLPGDWKPLTESPAEREPLAVAAGLIYSVLTALGKADDSLNLGLTHAVFHFFHHFPYFQPTH